MNTIFQPLDFQPRVLGGHMVAEDGTRLRNMKREAELFAPAGVLLRVRENRKGCTTSPHWAAWDVHFKAPGAKAGKCLVTFIHRNSTVFI